MKKAAICIWIIFSAMTLVFGCGGKEGSSLVQDTSFEDFELEAESYWNGSDLSGGFSSGGVFFNNDFNTDYQSWSGFAYSNMTDTTTPGYANQYSVIAGKGAGNSSTYVVASQYGAEMTATLSEEAVVDSVMINNTTYAYLSMQAGDDFAKKFGGDDGDDPDWFLLTIEGLDAQANITGTVEFYLADLRDDEEENDYIISDWTRVDTTALGTVSQLRFSLTSSDTGDFGMNTPAYFALDNIVFAD